MAIIRTKKLGPITLADKLKKAGAKPKKLLTEPLWEGPESTGPNGGITQSLLSLFIMCRERFRVKTILGLGEANRFSHRLEYGQMWHTCEEALASQGGGGQLGLNDVWDLELKKYGTTLCQKYPLQQEQIQHWYEVCKTQFPIYVGYWAKHRDVKERTPLLQEEIFNVDYQLPSGRVVRLRGKWDSVDLLGKPKVASICLKENKTKADINEEQMKKQLLFDLQTMTYLVALQEFKKQEEVEHKTRLPENWYRYHSRPVNKICYNVVRRPLSGGRGSITQKKGSKNVEPETMEEFYARLADIIRAEPEYFFMRWTVDITQSDIGKFKRLCLDPLLEAICDWWEFITTHLDDPFDPAGHGIHWRTPYGLYNPIAEGASTDLDEHLDTGSTIGLQRVDTLFPELQ